MRFIARYIKFGFIIPLIFMGTITFAQPGFPGPGTPGGGPPPNPCGWGNSNGKPCQPIPITSGIGFLIAAGMIIGIRKLYKSDKPDQ